MPKIPRLSLPESLRARLAAVFGIDLRTLALFRAALGAVLFADLALRLADLRSFYTDWGVMPRDAAIAFNGPYRISLHLANGTAGFALLMFLVEMLAAAALVLGWRARIAALLCFVLHGSLLNRDQMVLLGGDLLLVCLLFWAMFLPLGARWSVDAALARRPPPQKNQHLSWASAALLIQVMSVYFFSGYLKTGREWWPDGTAVDYALQLDQYALPLGVWLRENFPWLTTALTYFVFFMQRWGSLLMFFPLFNAPLRFVLTLLFMAMHVGFLFTLALGTFPFVSLASLTALDGGWIWERLDARAQRRERRIGPHALRIYYDRDCGFCQKMCLLFKTFLILPRAEIAPAQDYPRARTLLEANYSWVIIDHDDRAWLKWPAYVLLLRRSPLFGWLGRLLQGSALVRPGNAVYDFVGRNRGFFGWLSARLLPLREVEFDSSRLTQWLAGLMLFVVLSWNFCTLGWLPRPYYAFLTPPFFLARIDQLWDMFAPFPSKEDGWFVLPAELDDGREIDLLHPERGAVSYDKPRSIAAEHRSIRWHKYHERIWSAQFAGQRANYSRWLCRSWNDGHRGGELLRTFKIVFMLEMSVPRGQTPSIEQRVIWRWDCFGNPNLKADSSGR
jgi:predicted DCC family thiol-disulfide oxidoreductase YuxK